MRGRQAGVIGRFGSRFLEPRVVGYGVFRACKALGLRWFINGAYDRSVELPTPSPKPRAS